jgi:hypothetical protein
MRVPRMRFSVRRMMLLIVIIALLSSLVVQSLRVARSDRELARLGRLLDDYRRAANRAQWAENMHKKGYVSKAQVDAEQATFSRAKFSLGL